MGCQNEFNYRYNTLSHRSEDRLGKMDAALPIAQRFQDDHDRLQDWMQQMDTDLRGREPSGVEAEEQVRVKTNHPSIIFCKSL